jgi:hypothetical protein
MIMKIQAQLKWILKIHAKQKLNDTEDTSITKYSDGLRAGWPGFDSRQGAKVSLHSTASRPVLGPTQPPTQWVSGALSLE